MPLILGAGFYFASEKEGYNAYERHPDCKYRNKRDTKGVVAASGLATAKRSASGAR